MGNSINAHRKEKNHINYTNYLRSLHLHNYGKRISGVFSPLQLRELFSTNIKLILYELKDK